MGYYNSSLGWGMGTFGWIGMILFWGLIIWLILWLVNQNNKTENDKPYDILKRRYVEGKISKKEYEKVKRDIL